MVSTFHTDSITALCARQPLLWYLQVTHGKCGMMTFIMYNKLSVFSATVCPYSVLGSHCFCTRVVRQRDLLFSQCLCKGIVKITNPVVPTWSNCTYILNPSRLLTCFLSFLNLTESSVIMSSVITRLWKLKKQSSQHYRTTQTTYRARTKSWRRMGISQKVLSQAIHAFVQNAYYIYAFGEIIMSSMQHKPEHNSWSVKTCMNICFYPACA